MSSTTAIMPSKYLKVLGLSLGVMAFGSYLAVVCILAMYHPLEVSVISHVLFPMGVLGLVGMETKFGVVKLISVIIPRVFIILACLGWGQAYIGVVLLSIIAINIIEAVIMDGLKGTYCNAVVGLLLIGSLYFVQVEWTGQYGGMMSSSTWLWVLAYTIWGWQIVLNHTEGPYSITHFAVLLVPLVWIVFQGDVEGWLVMRELTLTLGISTLAVFRKTLKSSIYQVITPQQFAQFKQRVFSSKVQLILLVINISILAIQF